MTWHPEVLSGRQHRALLRLGPALTRWGFYLGGGTALALYLGHRRSVDLDWFTPNRLEDPLGLARNLRDEGVPLRVEQVAAGTLHGAMNGVRVSLFEYRYPLLKPVRPWPQGGCPLASRVDLAAMKLAAVAQRGSKKDFVDIYALARSSSSLPKMLRWYQEKYAVRDIAHVLYSLAYFEEADREPMPRLLWDTHWRRIKEELRRRLRGVTR
jgi:hypothetical protein